jgi:hypothetical protein
MIEFNLLKFEFSIIFTFINAFNYSNLNNLLINIIIFVY